jgi:5-(hydroxymethyl)furfural/furfural oxidase
VDRIRGIEYLHVADAGIMPTIPSANTNVPTIMVPDERIPDCSGRPDFDDHS